jgi:hypothetical protein
MVPNLWCFLRLSFIMTLAILRVLLFSHVTECPSLRIGLIFSHSYIKVVHFEQEHHRGCMCSSCLGMCDVSSRFYKLPMERAKRTRLACCQYHPFQSSYFSPLPDNVRLCTCPFSTFQYTTGTFTLK